MPLTSHVVVRSNKVSPAAMARLEAILYGTPTTPPRMPLPEEVIAIIRGDGVVDPPPDPGPDTPPPDGTASLVEDSNDPGTFTIQNASLVEDPADPGTYTVQKGLTEDPADPGTYTIGAVA